MLQIGTKINFEKLHELLNVNCNEEQNKNEDELLIEYNRLEEENKKEIIKNMQLHEELTEHLKLIKIDQNRHENVEDPAKIKEAYIETLLSYITLHENHQKEKFESENIIETLKKLYENKKEKYTNELKTFLKTLESTVMKLKLSKSKKPISDKFAKDNLNKIIIQLEKLDIVRKKCNMQNIILEEKETALKTLQTLECGLTLRDYEKLELKNQQLVNEIDDNTDRIDTLKIEFFKKKDILKKIKAENIELNNLCNTNENVLKEIEFELNKIKIDCIMLKNKRKKNLKHLESKSFDFGYLFDEELLQDYKNKTVAVKESRTKINMNKNKQPRKSTKLRNNENNKTKIKPRFHRTALLRPSINYETS